MKTTINYLILNQACADLMITIIEGMNAIHYSLMDNSWLGGLLGLITCKVFLAVVSSSYMFLRSNATFEFFTRVSTFQENNFPAVDFVYCYSFKLLQQCKLPKIKWLLLLWFIGSFTRVDNIKCDHNFFHTAPAFFDNSSSLHSRVFQTLVTTSARRGMHSKCSTSRSCKNGEKSYFDDDCCCCFAYSM